MSRKIYGIFASGGKGTRMGSETPKQFLLLGGRPVLMRTMEKFIGALPGMKIIAALPSGHIEGWKELCRQYHFDETQVLVKGGITRFHSVKNALEKVPDGAIVFVHDGVRPLLSRELIQKLAAEAEEHPAVIPFTKVTDTLKWADGRSGADPDRNSVIAVQTPQFFHSEVIKAAFRQGYHEWFTDESSVLKEANVPLRYVEGEKYNIKITTPDDLEIASLCVSDE